MDIVLPVLSGGFVWEHFCYLTYKSDIITVFFLWFWGNFNNCRDPASNLLICRRILNFMEGKSY